MDLLSHDQDLKTAQEKKLKEAMQSLYGSISPSVFVSADRSEVDETEQHEYAVRKSNKDAAYTNLAFRPYCSTIPVQHEPKKEAVRWAWLKK